MLALNTSKVLSGAKLPPRSASSLIGVALWCMLSTVHAQSCWVNGALGMNFGAISSASPTDSQAMLAVTCGSNTPPAYVRLCLFLPAGSPIGDLNPRRMSNYNGSSLAYDLYWDAQRTQVIGPSGSGLAEYTWTMHVPGSGSYSSVSTSVPVYGRVFARQTSVPSGNYQSQLYGAELRYSISARAYPDSCQGGATLDVGSPGVHANVPSGCFITAISDLDFGMLSAPINRNHDQSGSMTLQCPPGTSWQVDMGQGNHFQTTRRMSNGASGFVSYVLYQDPSRTRLWGSTTGGSTASGTASSASEQIPIYGRIPLQGGVSTGDYSDTVVVTVTY